MTYFDSRAREWDKDKTHMERSVAIAAELEKMIPIDYDMKALEYGAGTGILSFLLKDRFFDITLMDSSGEMINVCIEKAEYYKTNHIHPICTDIELTDYHEKFDIIYNQMVLHHVNDVETIFNKFYGLLNSGGYLAIADLYTEDGSFHGTEVKVHWGFNPDNLSTILKYKGFKNIKCKTCFEIQREPDKRFPIFLLSAQK